MRSSSNSFAVSLALSFAMLLTTAAFADKAQTFTGTLTDAMCGATHMMEGDPAACIRSCVNKGSKYALVVGDKVYTLDSSDKATLDALGKLGAQKATVKGTLDGETIAVQSVSPAK
jgi:hypothetical protein